MFSTRADWSAPLNALARARQAHRRPLLDLTGTNPTRAGLPYPHEELADAMARGARAAYEPDPRGIRSAREALAAELRCDPDDLILTASTSESYAFLFKLLANPGDSVVTATPSYPLLDHLARLELVELRMFPLELHRRWELERSRVAEAIDDRTRAIVIVNPNNPTGSFVAPAEQDVVASFGLPIVSDEVFLDYPLDGLGATFLRDHVLTFTLGGLSKSAGLPHFKLGWIRAGGPASARRDALDALELIADNFLSVATPVQIALPEILRIAPRIRASIAERERTSRRCARVSSTSRPPECCRSRAAGPR